LETGTAREPGIPEPVPREPGMPRVPAMASVKVMAWATVCWWTAVTVLRA
jgi:hypothetical protein